MTKVPKRQGVAPKKPSTDTDSVAPGVDSTVGETSAPSSAAPQKVMGSNAMQNLMDALNSRTMTDAECERLAQARLDGMREATDHAIRVMAQSGMLVSDDVKLTGREQAILKLVYDKKAFASDTLVKTRTIENLDGYAAGGFKRQVANLGKKGLLKTDDVPGGGVWLTRAGRRRAEKLRLA